MHKNAIALPNSTERSKISSVSLRAETLKLFFVAKAILEYNRRARHSDAEVFDAVVSTVHATIPELAVIVASVSKIEGERIAAIKVRRKTLDSVRKTVKKNGVGIKPYLHACFAIFVRAAAASAGPLILSEEFAHIKEDLYKVHSNWDVMLKSLRPVTIKSRKINPNKEVQEMRYHNYLELFHNHMQQYGGIDRLLNVVTKLSIHCLPIAGAPGKETPDDTPIEQNPGAVYLAKIWKRGRGYNITVLNRVESVEPGPAYGIHPTRREQISRPEIPLGSVIRLYDIYRNVDWRTAIINEDEV